MKEKNFTPIYLYIKSFILFHIRKAIYVDTKNIQTDKVERG